MDVSDKALKILVEALASPVVEGYLHEQFIQEAWDGENETYDAIDDSFDAAMEAVMAHIITLVGE